MTAVTDLNQLLLLPDVNCNTNRTNSARLDRSDVCHNFSFRAQRSRIETRRWKFPCTAPADDTRPFFRCRGHCRYGVHSLFVVDRVHHVARRLPVCAARSAKTGRFRSYYSRYTIPSRSPTSAVQRCRTFGRKPAFELSKNDWTSLCVRRTRRHAIALVAFGEGKTVSFRRPNFPRPSSNTEQQDRVYARTCAHDARKKADGPVACARHANDSARSRSEADRKRPPSETNLRGEHLGRENPGATVIEIMDTNIASYIIRVCRRRCRRDG